MARLAGLMASTVRLSARTAGGGNRATAKIAQLENIRQNGGSLLF
jgi:hypothetical protein